MSIACRAGFPSSLSRLVFLRLCLTFYVSSKREWLSCKSRDGAHVRPPHGLTAMFVSCFNSFLNELHSWKIIAGFPGTYYVIISSSILKIFRPQQSFISVYIGILYSYFLWTLCITMYYYPLIICCSFIMNRKIIIRCSIYFCLYLRSSI